MKRLLISALGATALAIGSVAAPARAESTPDDLDVAPVIVFLENYRLLAPPGTELPPDLVGDQVAGGQSWEIGDEVELYLNGTYVATSIAEQNGEGSASPFFDLGALGVTIEPGDKVELALADGSRVEIHVVRDIDVTEIDASADTVVGTAEPDSEVWVVLSEGVGVSVTADAEGTWMADFSVPGGAEYDIVDGTVIFLFQFDADGNATILLRAAEAPKPQHPVTRDHIVQVIPDDLPNPDDRNIVCPNTGPGEYAYFLVTGTLEYDLFRTTTRGVDRTRIDGEWNDVTAVLSDDLVLDPEEIDGTRYPVELDALVLTTIQRPDGSVVNMFRADGTITDPVTGEIVDTIDFFTTDRSGADEFLYNRGNCG